MQKPQEMWVWSQGRDDPLEEEMTTPFSILARKFHEQMSLANYHSWGHKESDVTEWLNVPADQWFPFHHPPAPRRISTDVSYLFLFEIQSCCSKDADFISFLRNIIHAFKLGIKHWSVQIWVHTLESMDSSWLPSSSVKKF